MLQPVRRSSLTEGQTDAQDEMRHPNDPLTTLVPQNPSIKELNVVRKRRSTDIEPPKGSVGHGMDVQTV